MKGYGKKRKDENCCPGHSKFPQDKYTITSTKTRKRRLKPAKARERQKNKVREYNE